MTDMAFKATKKEQAAAKGPVPAKDQVAAPVRTTPLSPEELMVASYGYNPPLVDFERKMVISWSAKSACTHVLIWFLAKNGLLYAANYYHAWPHRFRMDVLEKSTIFQAACNDAIRNPQKYTLVRFMRDPVARLSSSLRHMLRTRYNDNDLQAFLKRPFTVETGLTIAEFIKYMQLVDFKHTNMHHASQINKVDLETKFARKIFVKLDNPAQSLAEQINFIERDMSQLVTDFSKIRKLDWVKQVHYQDDKKEGTQEITLDTVLTFRDSNTWPDAKLTEFLRTRPEVAEVLAEDIAFYENPEKHGFSLVL